MKLTLKQKLKIRDEITLWLNDLRSELRSTCNLSSQGDFKIAQAGMPMADKVIAALERKRID